MTKISNIITKIFLTLLILSPAPIYFATTYHDLTNDSTQKQPWTSFFSNPNESVYISWETEEENMGKIKYGLDPTDLDLETAYEPSPTKIHHISLSGLTANTTYYYKVESEGFNSEIRSFVTAPNGPSQFSWTMYSDSQQPVIAPGHHKELANEIQKKHSSGKEFRFSAIVGDLVEAGNRKYLWDNFFDSASAYTDQIPIVPVVGNHDRIDRYNTYFNEYFINSENTTNKQFYWSFDYGHVHFSCLSFTYARDWEFTEEHINWIINDLEQAQDSTFRIVMFHSPIIGAGFFSGNENLLGLNIDLDVNMTQIFLDYNVTATIHGHEHHYERGSIQDMKYFILGGGGGAFDPGLNPQPQTEFLTMTPSYTEVDAKANSLIFKTYTLDGNLLDQDTIYAEGEN